MPRKLKVKTWAQLRNELLWPAVQLSGLGFFAWLNATHFDGTEMKMLAEFAAYWKIVSSIQSKVG
jgi:hypothetical protein